MAITPTLLRPIRPSQPREFVFASTRSKGPRRELITRSARCPYLCLMFHDMMCDTTPSILTPRLLLCLNRTRMFFILSFIDMNVTLTSTLKNRHTMADILSALTLLCCDYWLTRDQRWLMTSQQEIMATLSVQ